MKKRLAWWRAWWAGVRESYFLHRWTDADGYPVKRPACGRLAAAAKVAVAELIGLAGAVVCAVRGHRITMGGWSTPDSGGEYWRCERCGAGGTIHYY